MQQMQNAYCKPQINTRQQCYVYYEIILYMDRAKYCQIQSVMSLNVRFDYYKIMLTKNNVKNLYARNSQFWPKS